MAVSVVGSLYEIPEVDLLTFINEKVGADWVAANSHIASVTPVVVDSVIVSIRVGIETGN